jgi:signal transduction histidine kinase
VTGVLSSVLRPWRERETWWALVHVLLDVVIGAATFSVVISLLAITAGLLITFPLALPFAWLLFWSAHVIARVERSRFSALLGIDLPDPVPPLRTEGRFARLRERATSKARWMEIGYALLLLPLGVLTLLTSLVVWCGTTALIALPLYVGQLPGKTAKFGLFEVGPGGIVVLLALVGVVGLVLVAPWVTLLLARLDVAAARLLLSRPRSDEIDERVTQLETSRLAAVDSAESERRRIERDLHDGAQQRLVALAMDLGHARQRLESDPEGGRALVAEAHEEAKAALREIRDLVRGIHPVILEDRGLDAALSAVVARVPVPVRLQVEVPVRPSAAVESAAYFFVTEALTNITRHARATEAHVAIVRATDRLVVEVRDNGVGGADAARGTGLAGLRNRVTALGGTMDVISPEGGPTTLLATLPAKDANAAKPADAAKSGSATSGTATSSGSGRGKTGETGAQ